MDQLSAQFPDRSADIAQLLSISGSLRLQQRRGGLQPGNSTSCFW
jgi:hypothetical protein